VLGPPHKSAEASTYFLGCRPLFRSTASSSRATAFYLVFCSDALDAFTLRSGSLDAPDLFLFPPDVLPPKLELLRRSGVTRFIMAAFRLSTRQPEPVVDADFFVRSSTYRSIFSDFIYLRPFPPLFFVVIDHN